MTGLSLQLFGSPHVVERDRMTLEIRQFYPLPHRHGERSTFTVSAYFFFPRSFGVSEGKWNREHFYRDTSVFMRLHAPTLTLERLCDLRYEDNPAAVLLDVVKNALRGDAGMNSSATALAQMLGAELTDAIEAEADELERQLDRLQRNDEKRSTEHHVRDFCGRALAALRVLRRVRAEAMAVRGIAPPNLLPSLAFAEEYASATLEQRLSKLGHQVESRSELRDNSGAALRLRLLIIQALETLALRGKTEGFARPMGGDSEYYTYRLSLLKKELQRALYVNTRQSSADPFYANSAAMVAAGLAATWATLAQVPMLTANFATREGILLFAAAVGAYVMKDRIKEWAKNRLLQRWRFWDHNSKILGDTLASVGMGEFSGRARERMAWLSEAEVPEEIAELRRRNRTVRGSTTELEQVLLYRRRVSFDVAGSAPLPQGYGLQVILRLSMDAIIRRLDDPNEDVYLYDAVAGRFAHEELPRVYHLNVVVVTRHVETGHSYQHRSRVVLNKNGIVRVEPVA